MSTLPPNQRPDLRTGQPANPRIDELLADRALTGLDAAEQGELLRMAGVDAGAVTPEDIAAARAELAFLDPTEMTAMPADLKERLLASGEAWCRGVREAKRNEPQPDSFVFQPTPVAKATRWRMVPWLIAAASIAIALYALIPAVKPDPRTQREALIASASDAVTLTWGDWDTPEVAGVKGDVVWSESKQQGYLHFENLRTNDPTVEQYQLWIIDSRGMNQRISGAIFNGASGDVVIPIDPGIGVQGAAAFAVTIEKPGGTWVSDMTRRVVIAAK